MAWVNGNLGEEAAKARGLSPAVLVTASGLVLELAGLTSNGAPSRPALAALASLASIPGLAYSSEASVEVRDAAVVPTSRGAASGRESAEVLVILAGRARQATMLWQFRGPTVKAAIRNGLCHSRSLPSPAGPPPPPCLRVARGGPGAGPGTGRLSFALLSGDGVLTGTVDPSAASAADSTSVSAGSPAPFLHLGAEIHLPPLLDPRETSAGASASSAAASSSSSSSSSLVVTADAASSAARSAAVRAVGLALTPLHVFVAVPHAVVAINRRTREPARWSFEVPELVPSFRRGADLRRRDRDAPPAGAADMARRAISACVQDSASPLPPPAPAGPAASSASDPAARRVGIFALSQEKMVRVVVLDEGREEWRGLVRLARAEKDGPAARRLFEEAEGQARTPEARAWVKGEMADWLVGRGMAEEAAATLAETSRPFESVVLRFASEGSTRALIRYGTDVLERFVGQEEPELGRIPCTVLATWLLELHLSFLDEVVARRDEGVALARDDAGDDVDEGTAEAEALDHVAIFAGWLHAPTAIGLALSHGRDRVFEALW